MMSGDFWSDRSGGEERQGDAGAITTDPAELLIVESASKVARLRLRRPPGETCPLRIRSHVAWLQALPAEVPSGVDETQITFVPEQVAPGEGLAGSLETVLHIEPILIRAIDFGTTAPMPRVEVRVRVTLVPVPTFAPPVDEAETPPPSCAMATETPPGSPLVRLSTALLEVGNVPVDRTVAKTVTVSWLEGTPGLLRAERNVEWLSVSPARLDFRTGSRTCDLVIRIDGRQMQADVEMEGHVSLIGDRVAELVTVRAVREFEENVAARVTRLRSATTIVAASMLVLYLLALVLRWKLPPLGVGLPACAALAAGAGAETWRNTRQAASFWVGVAIAVALLVIGATRVPDFARYAALVLLPAAGIPLARALASSVAGRQPSAGWVVAAAPVAVGLACLAVLAGGLGVGLEPPRPAAMTGSGAATVPSAVTNLPGVASTPAQPPRSSASARTTAPAQQPPSSRTPTKDQGAASRETADPVPTTLGALKKYIRTNPHDVKALNRLAELELADGARESALKHWRMSLALEPQQPQIAERLAALEGR